MERCNLIFCEQSDIEIAVVRLTAGVSRLGWERGLAVETGKAYSQKNAQMTRRVPQVGCTRCWAVFMPAKTCDGATMLRYRIQNSFN